MCGSMVDIQSPAAEIRRGKKKKIDRRKKLQGKNTMAPLLHRAAIITKNFEHRVAIIRGLVTSLHSFVWSLTLTILGTKLQNLPRFHNSCTETQLTLITTPLAITPSGSPSANCLTDSLRPRRLTDGDLTRTTMITTEQEHFMPSWKCSLYVSMLS